MSRFNVSADIRSPLAISIRKAAGNDLDTAHVIPGSAIRGALAQHFLAGGSASSAAFKEMFLSGSVRFGDLRLNDYDVWPFSARSCKENPNRHPVGDVLLTTAAQIPAQPECQHANCGAKREQPRGWRFETKKGFEFPTVETRRVAHVEIDIETNGSRSGNFHSSRVICAEQRFDGWIWYSTATARDSLQRLLGFGRELYIGRGRSRGQGRLVLTSNFHSEPNQAPNVGEFNREAARRFPELRDYVLFSCLLRSRTIVFDRWLLSRACLEAADFGAGFKDYAPLTWSSRQVTISGWNAAAGLPKADVSGIAPGSCWLFAKRETNATARAEEIARIGLLLEVVEARGIGDRLAEGFGEVFFCDPFHWKKALREEPE